jgi:hypothetical protein
MKRIFLVIVSLLSSGPLLAQQGTLRVNGQRLEQRLMKLAEFGRTEKGNMRVAFSDVDLAVIMTVTSAPSAPLRLRKCCLKTE